MTGVGAGGGLKPLWPLCAVTGTATPATVGADAMQASVPFMMPLTALAAQARNRRPGALHVHRDPAPCRVLRHGALGRRCIRTEPGSPVADTARANDVQAGRGAIVRPNLDQHHVGRIAWPDRDGHAVIRHRLGVHQRHVSLEPGLRHGERIELRLLVPHDPSLLRHPAEARGDGQRQQGHHEDDKRERHAPAIVHQAGTNHGGS